MFDFITEEHKMIQQAARDFAQKSIVPIAAHYDETGDFPIETVRQMGELGFMGIEVPEEYRDYIESKFSKQSQATEVDISASAEECDNGCFYW